MSIVKRGKGQGSQEESDEPLDRAGFPSRVPGPPARFLVCCRVDVGLCARNFTASSLVNELTLCGVVKTTPGDAKTDGDGGRPAVFLLGI